MWRPTDGLPLQQKDGFPFKKEPYILKNSAVEEKYKEARSC